MGIPTVTITREGFSQVVANAFAGMEFPADASRVIFSVNMFIAGSDLSPIDARLDDIVGGLTKWKPQLKDKKVAAASKIKVSGKDYEEFSANVNQLFLKNMWADGLPIVPPTEKLVKTILTGTSLPPDKVIGKMLPRGGIVTVETIAANLAMAGGRPEYLPVLLAAVQAICANEYQHFRMNSTTCSVYPVVIVNGPIAKQLRINSGYGCLGPDPLHPAGASIGRAIRFLLQDAGGAVPGIGTMAIYGGASRFTNVVFAEDEEGMPGDWQPLNVEQGFARGTNTVTTYVAASTVNIIGGEADTDAIAAETLNMVAAVIGIPNGNYWVRSYYPEGVAGIYLMARGTAQALAKICWSKERVRNHLWENSKVPLKNIGRWVRWMEANTKGILQDPMPISRSPKGIKIVVAGGIQSGHMQWMQVGCCPEAMTSAKIELPANWDKLLTKAEEDLGPIPTI